MKQKTRKPMKYFIQAIPAGLLLSVLTGCVMVGDRVDVNRLFVHSDPPGAQVTLSSGEKGVTPCQFLLPTRGKAMVVIEKEGYEQQEIFVEAVPTLGSVVQSVLTTGGGSRYPREHVYEFKPNPIEVKLKRKENPAQ